LSGVAPDGSPVDVYRALPLAGEDGFVADAVPPPATLLDLGSGPGRITHSLVARGYDVTAVDDSEEMLRHVCGARTILADIRSLRLHRRFDCVLLASHFVNDAHDDSRRAALRTCAAHLDRGGALVAEAYPPAFDWGAAVGRTSRLGDVVVRVDAASRSGSVVDAVVSYRLGRRRWRQSFSARMFDDDELRAELAEAELVFDRWLDRDRGWFVANGAAGAIERG
jgi:SAM-dependent methyltransferase